MPKPKAKTVQISARVTHEVSRALSLIAAEEDRNVAQVVRRAIELFLASRRDKDAAA